VTLREKTFADMPRLVRALTYLLLPGLVVHELAHAGAAWWVGGEATIDWSVPVVEMSLPRETSVPQLVAIMLAPLPLAVAAALWFFISPPDLGPIEFVYLVFQLAAVANVTEDVRLLLAKVSPVTAR
jgi:hypothetical protein